jgi:hypothetical protein
MGAMVDKPQHRMRQFSDRGPYRFFGEIEHDTGPASLDTDMLLPRCSQGLSTTNSGATHSALVFLGHRSHRGRYWLDKSRRVKVIILHLREDRYDPLFTDRAATHARRLR